MDDHTAAAKLFGPDSNPTPEPAAAPAPQPGSLEEQASRLFPAQAATIPPDMVTAAIATKLNGSLAGFGNEELDPAMREELAATLPAVLADIGMDSLGAGEFSNLIGEYTHQRPTERQVREWEAESIKQASNLSFSELDIRDAQRLATADPRVRWILEATQLGNHPAVLREFVALGRRQRMAGKL